MPFIISGKRYPDILIVVPTVVTPPHAFVKSVLVPSKLHEKYIVFSGSGRPVVLVISGIIVITLVLLTVASVPKFVVIGPGVVTKIDL